MNVDLLIETIAELTPLADNIKLAEQFKDESLDRPFLLRQQNKGFGESIPIRSGMSLPLIDLVLKDQYSMLRDIITKLNVITDTKDFKEEQKE